MLSDRKSYQEDSLAQDYFISKPIKVLKLPDYLIQSLPVIGKVVPSEIFKLSLDDIEITRYLYKSFDIVGINVLDHIVVSYGGYFSFKQKQML